MADSDLRVLYSDLPQGIMHHHSCLSNAFPAHYVDSQTEVDDARSSTARAPSIFLSLQAVSAVINSAERMIDSQPLLSLSDQTYGRNYSAVKCLIIPQIEARLGVIGIWQRFWIVPHTISLGGCKTTTPNTKSQTPTRCTKPRLMVQRCKFCSLALLRSPHHSTNSPAATR